MSADLVAAQMFAVIFVRVSSQLEILVTLGTIASNETVCPRIS